MPGHVMLVVNCPLSASSHKHCSTCELLLPQGLRPIYGMHDDACNHKPWLYNKAAGDNIAAVAVLASCIFRSKYNEQRCQNSNSFYVLTSSFIVKQKREQGLWANVPATVSCKDSHPLYLHLQNSLLRLGCA